MENPTLKSIRKVYSYIKEKKKTSPSEIAFKIGIHYRSVNAVIDFLQEFEKVRIVSNGRFRIIELIEQGVRYENNNTGFED